MLLYLCLAFVLTVIPYLGVYVRLINTVIHEVSHVLIARLTGGRGYHITLSRDTSGTALTGSASWFGSLLTAYAGYTGSSLAALLLFYLLHEGHYQVVVLLFVIIFAIAAALWIRNLFGLLWITSFLCFLGYMIYRQWELVMMHTSYLLASILLIESVMSAATIFIISVKNPQEAGDAANLQRFTYIPAFVWGALFFGQSVYIGYKIIETYIMS